MKSLEIFSGAGGLAQGLHLAGFHHEALVEWKDNACESLRANFKDTKVIQSDIRDFDFAAYKKVDILAGGPPCQPFSLGGKHQGQMDKRDMFPYTIEGLREIQPKAFIFENVKGLLRKSFTSYFNYIILQLSYPEVIKGGKESWLQHLERLKEVHTKGTYKGIKYKVAYEVLNAANYGVPQKRERVIIVGIREDLNITWTFPQASHSKERLLWDKFVTGEYWEKLKIVTSKRETLTPTLKRSVEKLKSKYGLFEPSEQAWVTVRAVLQDLPEPKESLEFKDHQLRTGAKAYPGHTGSYIDEPSKTLKAGGHGVPGGENMIRFSNGKLRYFSILEAKRMQTFADDYIIKGAWSEGMRQLGNAVPVKLGQVIGRQLYEKIKHRESVKKDSNLLPVVL